MVYNYSYQDRDFIRLLKMGAFERRPGGSWRFGTKTIRSHIIARLIDAGHAIRQGDLVVAVER